MSAEEKVKNILIELKGHAPFTLFGALTGIVFMLLFKNVEQETSERLFYIFHPAHVILSAMVTASMFKLHTRKSNFFLVLIIGYIGSIGIATVSDCLIPYAGEILLGLEAHSHIGFIEGWYVVNPAAILGILIAYFWPKTKFPHSGHVLLSTWASLFHILMALGSAISVPRGVVIFIFLFIAVWLPCCISDIIFPLLLVKSDIKLTDTYIRKDHIHHSHPHTHEHSDKCQGQKEQQQ